MSQQMPPLISLEFFRNSQKGISLMIPLGKTPKIFSEVFSGSLPEILRKMFKGNYPEMFFGCFSRIM